LFHLILSHSSDISQLKVEICLELFFLFSFSQPETPIKDLPIIADFASFEASTNYSYRINNLSYVKLFRDASFSVSNGLGRQNSLF